MVAFSRVFACAASVAAMRFCRCSSILADSDFHHSVCWSDTANAARYLAISLSNICRCAEYKPLAARSAAVSLSRSSFALASVSAICASRLPICVLSAVMSES